MLPASEVISTIARFSPRDAAVLRHSSGDVIVGPAATWDRPAQLVAWLYCLATEPRRHGTFSPGRAAGVLYARHPEERAGLERHVGVLCTTWPEPSPDDLKWFVRRLDMAGITIDWAQLLTDLRAWDAEDRHVAKGWMRESLPRAEVPA